MTPVTEQFAIRYFFRFRFIKPERYDNGYADRSVELRGFRRPDAQDALPTFLFVFQ